jgi:hypothetical protein
MRWWLLLATLLAICTASEGYVCKPTTSGQESATPPHAARQPARHCRRSKLTRRPPPLPQSAP